MSGPSGWRWRSPTGGHDTSARREVERSRHRNLRLRRGEQSVQISAPRQECGQAGIRHTCRLPAQASDRRTHCGWRYTGSGDRSGASNSGQRTSAIGRIESADLTGAGRSGRTGDVEGLMAGARRLADIHGTASRLDEVRLAASQREFAAPGRLVERPQPLHCCHPGPRIG